MTAPAAPSRPRRRLRVPWALVPIALALAYGGVRAFLDTRASLEEMVPEDAVLVWRFRDLEAFDALRSEPASGTERFQPASAVLGGLSNLPGLPGVDRTRPVIDAVLPPERRPDPRYVVFPVADAAAMRATYRNPDLPERHARHLEIRGAWAASAADRTLVREAGTFRSPLPPSEGEDWCVTARWPAFCDLVVRPDQAAVEPWTSILAGLGFVPDAPGAPKASADGGVVVATKTGRVPLVRAAWDRVTLRSFPGRLVADLAPASAAKELVAALAAARPDPVDDREPAPPPATEAFLHVRGAQGRRVLVAATGYAGLPWTSASAQDDFAALRLAAPGSFTAWATLSEGTTPSWHVALLAPREAFPDLAAFGASPGSDGRPAAFPAGVATITAPYGGAAEATSAATTPLGSDGAVVVAVLGGAAADAVRAQTAATVAFGTRTSPRDTPDRIEVATFSLGQIPAQRFLGARALGPGGVFSTLAGRSLRGRLLVVRGTTLRLELEGS